MTATYEKIATTTLGTSTATVTFSSITGSYTDLVLICNVAQAAGGNAIRFRFNSDTGSNYSRTSLIGNGSSATSSRESNISSGLIAETVAATTFGTVHILNVFNYSNTTTYKTTTGRGNNASSTVDATVCLWRNTAAITSIELALGAAFPTNNFASGSIFTIYGIKAE
jgi:hypothetical protein